MVAVVAVVVVVVAAVVAVVVVVVVVAAVVVLSARAFSAARPSRMVPGRWETLRTWWTPGGSTLPLFFFLEREDHPPLSEYVKTTNWS